VTAAKENSLVLFGEKSPVPANEAKVKSADQLSLNPSDMPPDIRFMMLMAKLMSKRKKEIDEYLEDDNTEHEIGANFNSRRLPRSIPALLRMQDELSNRIKEESVKAAESKKKADVHEAESIENAAKASWWSSIGPSITSFVGVAKEALKAAGVGIGFALGGPVGAALVGAIELAIAGVCACCSKQRSIDQAKNKLDAAKENYNAGVTQSSVAKLNSQASEIGAQIGMVNNLFSLATQAYNFMVGVMQAVIASAHEMRSKIAGGIGR
jgi:hypothetical protein